jgi:putative (di)nucleoside polyphosphate hydrolase
VKTTSHGVLVVDADGELLLCHATGGRHWDIPKGSADAGENSAEAAAREAREECGVVVDAGALLELGRFDYRPDKDLVLHAVLVDRFDAAQCVCSSVFVDHWGRSRPEMDDFRWTPFGDVPVRCAKNMARVLTQGIALPDVLARLRAAR